MEAKEETGKEMIVYGIYQGCIHEGGGVGSPLYKSEADARKALILAVEEANETWDEEDEYYWRQDELGEFRSGSEVLCIQSFEII